VVTQYGQRHLWDELETAYRTWLSAGQPGQEHFRLLVSPEGQRVVLDRRLGPKLQPAAT
jgi:protein-L-isoaspartate(D-aspartate) O-methyltransferase